jgi:hypothetical protein
LLACLVERFPNLSKSFHGLKRKGPKVQITTELQYQKTGWGEWGIFIEQLLAARGNKVETIG